MLPYVAWRNKSQIYLYECLNEALERKLYDRFQQNLQQTHQLSHCRSPRRIFETFCLSIPFLIYKINPKKSVFIDSGFQQL